MGDLIRAFQAVVAAAVARFDGHVAKLMGDGTLVYFGYPRAHEDDAERAARAGLGIVEAVETLRRDRGIALEVRAGIATGLVVVGELMGEGEARSAALSVIRPIWRRGCKPWQSRAAWWLRNPRGGCLAARSILRRWGRRP